MPFDAFLQFDSVEDRNRFLDSLKAEHAELAQHLRAARSLPVLRARQISEATYRTLQELLGDLGEIFRDVKFDTFP